MRYLLHAVYVGGYVCSRLYCKFQYALFSLRHQPKKQSFKLYPPPERQE